MEMTGAVREEELELRPKTLLELRLLLSALPHLMS